MNTNARLKYSVLGILCLLTIIFTSSTALSQGGFNFPVPTVVPIVSTNGGLVVPDSMGMAGPKQFLATINSRIITFDKISGQKDGKLDVTPNTFFSSVRNSLDAYDPVVRYDVFSSRWFVFSVTNNDIGTSTNRLLIAISSQEVVDSNSWVFYWIAVNDFFPTFLGCFLDQPRPALDRYGIYVGIRYMECDNDSNPGTGGNRMGFIRKSDLLNASPGQFTNVYGYTVPAIPPPISAEGTTGVDNFDSNVAQGYFVGLEDQVADPQTLGGPAFIKICNVSNISSGTPQ